MKIKIYWYFVYKSAILSSVERLFLGWNMSVSYKKLWKLLIDKNMSKMDLLEAAGLSTGTLAKLGKNGNVTTDILVKICKALDCDISDIMEVVKNNKEDKVVWINKN